MHIGELARRAGLSVKTVRYYSDLGLVPESARTTSGYRRFDSGSVVRLEYVRTLRELGLDLATIRRLLERQDELPRVAAAHAEALGAQIRLLRIQRGALRALARRDPTPQEVERMTKLAQATAEERRRLINEFLDSIFEGIGESSSGLAQGMRQAMPELPDEPTEEQVDAWIELAELVADEGFREKLRAMGRESFGTADGTEAPKPSPVDPQAAARNAGLVAERAGAAIAAGVDPASPQADTVHDELVGAFAAGVGRSPDAAYRRELLTVTEASYEPRAERYWQLIAIINGWAPITSVMAEWRWFYAAMRARL